MTNDPRPTIVRRLQSTRDEIRHIRRALHVGYPDEAKKSMQKQLALLEAREARLKRELDGAKP